MGEQPGIEPATAEYILVALDASPHSEAALVAAAELAAVLHLELRGLFVEDVNLLHLSGLPFGLEIGSFTAKARRLDAHNLEREFRIQATLLRKIMADVAGQRRVSWSFQVVRGGVTSELLAASSAARMLSLGRAGRNPGKRTGSTAQAVARNTRRPVIIQPARRRLSGPFTVAHLGTPTSDNALTLAVELARNHQDAIHVLVLAPAQTAVESVQTRLAELDVAGSVSRVDTDRELLAQLRLISEGTIVLPVEVAPWLDEVVTTVIVVP